MGMRDDISRFHLANIALYRKSSWVFHGIKEYGSDFIKAKSSVFLLGSEGECHCPCAWSSSLISSKNPSLQHLRHILGCDLAFNFSMVVKHFCPILKHCYACRICLAYSKHLPPAKGHLCFTSTKTVSFISLHLALFVNQSALAQASTTFLHRGSFWNSKTSFAASNIRRVFERALTDSSANSSS